ncbi:nudix hydrolase 20 [Gymnopus androsaceus JB14]|uniref:Nudix hydrolase 20 n=1 Tax=Gymnopus androsaceus JB14 TaxID=1447944 RepID=A0A6A4H372_9AGAR|nr:nudix hydrolase 20 [Gymnopus androsaceus JB14]
MPNDLTFLQLVQRCDNFSSAKSDSSLSEFDSEELVSLYLSDPGPQIGLLRPIIVQKLKIENERSRKKNLKELWSIHENYISFASWANTPSKRTEAMKELCERWRDTGLFPDVCGPKKWRAELYPVYKDPFGPHDAPLDSDESNFAFDMERSACALFGVVTYEVHLTIYQEIESETKPEGRELKIWVPTRAKTKQTWPGYLDNTVAGGIPSGMGIFESLVKECMEEASIAADVVQKHARCTGSISYFFRNSAGWLQPEVAYVYDMAIPPKSDLTLFTPKPLDGEVESFELLDRTTVMARMRAGKFKENCALVIIDLLIRLGYITPDNQPDFMKIITRMHGRFEYDLKW